MIYCFLFGGLTLPFAFAGFASLLGLVCRPLFGREVRGRFDTLFAQTLVLDFLLMLDHPLFLLVLERTDLLLTQLLVLEQIFVDKERRPCVRRSITRLLGREVGVLPVGELLRFGYLATETDSEQFLESEIEDAVLYNHLLDVDAVGGCEITPATQSVDIVLEGKSYLAHLRISKEIR